ncbi:MAG: hypothetical protein R3Y28_04775 [Candidatus Gastranaerophilales bacterium]
MNLSISSIKFKNNQQENNQVSSQNKLFGIPTMTKPLNKDTVSFTGKPDTIERFVEKSFEFGIPKLQKLAITYLDIVESIAMKLEKFGIIFDRAAQEPHSVKSATSSTSKLARSGEKPLDLIRTTLYSENPYDVQTLFSEILPEFEKRGYVLAEKKVSVLKAEQKGYKLLSQEDLALPEHLKAKKMITVPDLDLRLDPEKVDVTKIPAGYSHALSKPQKSGYEDIQMRFVREFDPSKKYPQEHELIILFGKNYDAAKHMESDNVYNAIRKFDELSLDTSKAKFGSGEFRAQRYIDMINEFARGKFSQKLFLNGKNKDFYQISNPIPIEFNAENQKVLDGYFTGLKSRVIKIYQEKLKAARSTTRKKEIQTNAKADKALIDKIKTELNDGIQTILNSKTPAKKKAANK